MYNGVFSKNEDTWKGTLSNPQTQNKYAYAGCMTEQKRSSDQVRTIQ